MLKLVRVSASAVTVAVVLALGASTASAQSPSTPPSSDGVVTTTDGDGFSSALGLAVAIAADGGQVIVGKHATGFFDATGATAWHSADGTSWTEQLLPGSKGAAANAIVASGGQLVVVGATVPTTLEGFPTGLVWTSNDGLSWSLAAKIKNATLNAITATADGYAAVGHVKKKSKSAGAQQVPTLWTSTDATAWKATVLPGTDSGNAVAQNLDGVTVVVENRAGGAGTGPGLLRSTDGVSWDALDFPAEPVTGGQVVSAGQVGLIQGGFALVSNIATPGASTSGSVWTSVDGATWQKAASAPFLLYAVAGGPTSSVFESRVQLTTTDGITWQEVQRADIEWAIAAATTQDGAAVVVDGVLKSPPSLIVHAVPAVAALAPGVTPAPFATPQPTAVAATSDPLCDPILAPADVAAITGQQVVSVKGDLRQHPPGDYVGPSPDIECHWALASGATVDLDVVYEWDDYAPDLQWADKLDPKYVPGTHKVKGLGVRGFGQTDASGVTTIAWVTKLEAMHGRPPSPSDFGQSIGIWSALDSAVVDSLARAVNAP